MPIDFSPISNAPVNAMQAAAYGDQLQESRYQNRLLHMMQDQELKGQADARLIDSQTYQDRLAALPQPMNTLTPQPQVQQAQAPAAPQLPAGVTAPGMPGATVTPPQQAPQPAKPPPSEFDVQRASLVALYKSGRIDADSAEKHYQKIAANEMTANSQRITSAVEQGKLSAQQEKELRDTMAPIHDSMVPLATEWEDLKAAGKSPQEIEAVIQPKYAEWKTSLAGMPGYEKAAQRLPDKFTPQIAYMSDKLVGALEKRAQARDTATAKAEAAATAAADKKEAQAATLADRKEGRKESLEARKEVARLIASLRDNSTAKKANLTTVEVQKIGDAIMRGEQPPDMQGRGMAKIAPQLAAYFADKGFDMTTAQADWQAVKTHVKNMNGPQQLRLGQAISFTRESLPIIRSLAAEWKAGGFAPLNSLNLHAAATGAYRTKAASIATRLESQISDLTSELGTVYKGGNSSTDESLKLAAANLKSKWEESVLNDNVDQIEKNLSIRENSMRTSGVAGLSSASLYAPGAHKRPAAPAGSQQQTVPRLAKIMTSDMRGRWNDMKRLELVYHNLRDKGYSKEDIEAAYEQAKGGK